MTTNSLRFLRQLADIGVSAVAVLAHAQSFPSRHVVMAVPYPAGAPQTSWRARMLDALSLLAQRWKDTSVGRPGTFSVAVVAGVFAITFPARSTISRVARSLIASTGSRACSSTRSACLPTSTP